MRPLVNLLRRVAQNRYMLGKMVARDIRSRYIGSFLGLFWSIIHPLTQLLIYYFVFSMVLRVKLGPEYGGTHFALWLLVGLLPWMLFSEVVSRAPQAVLEQAGLIKKMVFPSELLPLAHLAAALVNHGIAFSLLLVFLVIGGNGLTWKCLLVLPYLVAISLFATGLSWILSSLNVFLRDIGQVVGVFMQIWFYLTPIIYPASIIPARFRDWLMLNPLYHAIEGYRLLLLGKTLPPLGGFLYLALAGMFTMAVGGLLFKKLKPAFADVL